ncbi:hypothetical protein [Bdellovibrio sp. KM01]|uniref:hypothetical protein n=1 Tax=Bdellovibrio sp. KM01 TaxID=2748865 RepID=UPI0015E8F7E0|nr:hypothetical protein [Bdellovibrio sp. KM01]QLY25303.1 hypothetical protein HW988_18100 [Bdellovibrio sp. KM01]
MSIVQVLVGFGLATILGLVLAEMGVNSSKQGAQIRASMERAAIVQSLQSIISNSKVCKTSVNFAVFGPEVPVPASEATNFSKSVRVGFFLDKNTGTPPNGRNVPVMEGQEVKGFSLTTEWIRAFDPQLVDAPELLPPKKLYVATVKMKFRQTSTLNKGAIDLRPIEVGKVFFITSNAMPSGTIEECYGNNAGAYVCPDDQIQIVDNGYWKCVPIKDAIGKACSGGSQMVKTGSAGGTADCQTFYKMANGCEGAGSATVDASCQSRSCTVTTSSGGGSNHIPVTIPAINVRAQTVPGTSFTIVTSSGSGSGTSPTGGSSQTITIPSRNIDAYTIPATTVYVDVPAGGSVSTSTKYYRCDGSVCDQGSSLPCPNNKL